MEVKPAKLLQGIDTVIVRVSDIQKSKDWYVNQLGLQVSWENAGMGLVVLDAFGPTSITLWQTDQKMALNKHTAAYPIFRTADAAALRQALMQKNIEVSDLISDSHVHYIIFYDPDGNVLEACQVHGQ